MKLSSAINMTAALGIGPSGRRKNDEREAAVKKLS